MSLSLEDLKKIESSLQLQFPLNWSGKFETISAAKELKQSSLVFIKDRKFVKVLAEKLTTGPCPGGLGVVISEDVLSYANENLPAQEIFKQGGCFLLAKNIPVAMARISKIFFDLQNFTGNDLVDGRQMGTTDIHPTAMIAQGVFIGANVKIGANVQILPGAVLLSHCEIAEGTTIFPNVVIYRFVKIGKNCRIHSGAVVGADGFGYQFHQGVHEKIWHIGSVIIGNGVEIGAGTTVDRGTFSNTVIEDGCIIDNQVQIAHNCHLGKGVVICGQTGFAGSVDLGAYSVAGGSAAFAPDVKVGAQSQIAGLAGVTTDWPEKSVIAGNPARPLKEWLRSMATLRKLMNREKEN